MTPDLVEQTAAAVAADYPGLRRVHPHAIGAPLSAVTLDARLTARYTWSGYEVHVQVSAEDHFNRDDPEDRSLQRQVRAHATLLVPGARGSTRGHVEWDMHELRTELAFPAALSAAAADRGDPRFASAVLATVAKALDHVRAATDHAQLAAARAAQEKQWESERPEGVLRSRWLRQKRAELHDASARPDDPS